MASPFASQWKHAIEDELSPIRHHEVRSLVDKPRHKKPIPVRWVYRIKPDNSQISVHADPNAAHDQSRFRAHLCVRGLIQGRDSYDEIFAPTARFDTMRALFALSTAEITFPRQFDMKSAFFLAETKEGILN